MNDFIDNYFSEIQRKLEIVSHKSYIDSLIKIFDSYNIDKIDDEPYGEFTKEEMDAKSLLSNFFSFIEKHGGIVELPEQETSFPDYSIVFNYNNSTYVINTLIGQGAVTTLSKAIDTKYIPSVTLFPEEGVNVRIEDELVQYLIVNKDLNMSPGKVSAQVGHACTVCAVERHDEQFKAWYQRGQKKIILGAHQKVLEKFESEGYISIHDFGLTEIPANSLTVVSLGITRKSIVRDKVKKLQLYK